MDGGAAVKRDRATSRFVRNTFLTGLLILIPLVATYLLVAFLFDLLRRSRRAHHEDPVWSTPAACKLLVAGADYAGGQHCPGSGHYLSAGPWWETNFYRATDSGCREYRDPAPAPCEQHL